MPRLEVTFLVDANGILCVTATDLRTGRERTVEVKPSYGLTDEEIERMLEESFDHAEDDIQQRQLREARVDADTILHATRDVAAAARRSARARRARAHRGGVAALAEAREAEDHIRIRELYDELSRITEPFAQRIMDAALQDAMVSRPLEEL